MKKIKSLIYLTTICVTVLLSGCGNQNNIKVIGTENLNMNETQFTSQAQVDADGSEVNVIADQSYWNVGLHSFCMDSDGNYYYIDENDYCLMVFNPETGEAKPVCEKEGCDHLEMDCNAYIDPFNYCMNSLYYYRGHLYMISIYNSRYCLIQMNTDGTGRKNIATLGYVDKTINENIYNLTFSGNYVYYVERKFGTMTNLELSTVLFREPLSGGDYEVVVNLNTYDDMVPARIKSYDNLIFYLVGNYNKKTGEPEYVGLYAYNSNVGFSTQVVEGNISDYTFDTIEQCMYLYLTGSGLYKMDMKSGELTKIVESNDDSLKQISWDGKYIYMSNYSDDDMAVTDDISIYDSTGKLVRIIESTGWMTPYEVSYGDSRFMFATENFTGVKVYVFYDKSNELENEKWSEIDNWFLQYED